MSTPIGQKDVTHGQTTPVKTAWESMDERRRSLQRRLSDVPEIEESRGYFSSSNRASLGATSASSRPAASSSDSVPRFSSRRRSASVREPQTHASFEAKSFSSEISSEDLEILVRHVCRVVGTIVVKNLAEYIPGVDSKTTLGVIARLLATHHIRKKSEGRYTFVDPAGQIETGTLEQELKVLMDMKQKIIERRNSKFSPSISHPQEREGDLRGPTESEEKESTPFKKFTESGLNEVGHSSEAVEVALERQSSGSISPYDNTASIGKPSSEIALEDSATLLGPSEIAFESPSAEPPQVADSSVSFTQALNICVPHVDSTVAIAEGEPSEELPDLTEAENTPSRPVLADVVNEFRSITPAQRTNMADASNNLISFEVPVLQSAPQFKGVSSVDEPQKTHAAQGGEKSNQLMAAANVETGGSCEALEVVCENFKFRAPAYSTTYMPQDRVYYCLLFVGGSSFPSYPTAALTEREAKEVAAQRALQDFGLTLEMVATRSFANAKFPMKRIQ